MHRISHIRATCARSMGILPLALLSTLCISALPTPSFAYEVDNFTDRNQLTEDSLPVLDKKVNDILARAIKGANKESPDRCDRMILRQEIVRWTGPDPVSLLEFWSTFSEDIKHSRVGLDHSIYAGTTLKESPSMWLAGIGRSFKVASFIIGTDKIGHFFMQGLDYFKQVKHEGKEINQVLREEHGEDGVWGLKTSGVKSYADMAANYQGYLFWSRLHAGDRPYVRCEKRHWVKARAFTWLDYVSDAWDEGINCSEMKPGLAERVQRNLSKLGMKCPIDPEKCAGITRLDKSEFFTSPVCKDIASPARRLAHER